MPLRIRVPLLPATGVIGPGLGLVKVWTGSAWAEKPAKYWNGSAWIQKPARYWNGSAWVSP